MDNDRIELVSSADSPTGVAGRRVNGNFAPQGKVPGSNVEPDSADPAVLSSDSFSAEPDIELPDTPQSTQVSGEVARMESQTQSTDQFLEQLGASIVQSGSAESQSFANYISAQLGQQTEAELQDAAFRQDTGFGSVDELKAQVTDYNNQIRAEQHALNRRIQELEKNKGGGLASGVANEIKQAEKESLRKQADLAILQEATLGKYRNALEIANRAIDAELSEQEMELSVLGTIYDRNKSIFDRDEQRLFEVRMHGRQMAIEAERADKKQLQTTKLEAMRMAQLNGAPREVIEAIQSAPDPLSVIAVGGQYASSDMLDRQYKRAQIASVYSTINERERKARERAAAAEAAQEEKDETRRADTEKALGIRELASQLATDPGLSSAVGFGFKKSVLGSIPLVSGDAVSGTARADFEANATRLANMLTISKLDLMSGVLSESDIRILESAGSNLANFDQSEQQYKEEVNRILQVANRTIENNGLDEEQAVFWGFLEPDDLDAINDFYPNKN